MQYFKIFKGTTNSFSQEYYKLNTILVFLISLLAIPFIGLPLFIDGADTAWHIAAGQLIREHAALPYSDTWSYLEPKQQWYNISWLFDLAISTIFDSFGGYALLIFTRISTAILIAIVYWQLCARHPALHHDAIMITMVMVAFIMFEFSFCRPQIAAYFVMLLAYQALQNYMNQNRLCSLLSLIFWVIVWSNIHGSFIFIFVFLGVYGLELFTAQNKMRYFNKLIIVGLPCSAAKLCTPLGYKIYIGVMRTLHSNITSYILEWHPFHFGEQYGFTLTISVLLVAALSMKNNYKVISITQRDWVLGVFCLFSALISFRNFSHFALLGAPLMASSIDRALPPARYPSKLPARIKKLLLVALFASNIAVYTYFNEKLKGLLIYPEGSPKHVAEFLAQCYPGYKFTNQYSIGSYLSLFAKNGKMQYFIDGRAGTAFTEKQLEEAIDLHINPEKIMNIANKHKADGIILDRAYHKYILPEETMQDWKLIYQSDYYSVYIKDTKDALQKQEQCRLESLAKSLR